MTFDNSRTYVNQPKAKKAVAHAQLFWLLVSGFFCLSDAQ